VAGTALAVAAAGEVAWDAVEQYIPGSSANVRRQMKLDHQRNLDTWKRYLPQSSYERKAMSMSLSDPSVVRTSEITDLLIGSPSDILNMSPMRIVGGAVPAAARWLYEKIKGTEGRRPLNPEEIKATTEAMAAIDTMNVEHKMHDGSLIAHKEHEKERMAIFAARAQRQLRRGWENE
jgi:hypothetical protein